MQDGPRPGVRPAMLLGAIVFSEQPGDALPIVCIDHCGDSVWHLAHVTMRKAPVIYLRAMAVPTITALVLCMGDECPHHWLDLVDLDTCETSLMRYMPLARATVRRQVMLGTPRCGGHEVTTEVGGMDGALRFVNDVRRAFGGQVLALNADKSMGSQGCVRRQAPPGPVASTVRPGPVRRMSTCVKDPGVSSSAPYHQPCHG
jgi:hypothetical protein